jgi:hypothetical protein
MVRSLTIALVPFVFSLALLTAISARATLVAYEGFDMGASAGSLSGKAGATSIGFDAAGWGSLTAGNALYETAGLTFGSGANTLLTTGGNGRINGDPSLAARISRGLNATVTGTVWGSYLVNRAFDPSDEQDIIHLFVNQNAGASANDNNAEFVTSADEFNSNLGGLRGKNTPSFPNYNTGSPLTNGQTYLVLFKATNLGGTTGAASVNEWILSSGQFDTFKPGGLTEAELNGASTGTSSSSILQRGSISYTPSGAYPRVTAADVITLMTFRDVQARYDEIRLSNASLDEVSPVPEISSILLVGLVSLGLAGAASVRRLRQA